MARRLGLLLALAIAAFLFAEVSPSGQRRLPPEAEVALTEQALAFLRSEYNILVTGNPPAEALVPRLSGMSRSEISGEDRIAALLKGRKSSLEHGKHHTSIEVNLSSIAAEQRDGRVALRAVANIVEHFTFDFKPSPPMPDVYEESTRHDFIFSVAPLSASSHHNPYTVRVGDFEYTLIKDITEPQLLRVAEQDGEAQKYIQPQDIPLKSAPPAVNNRQKQKKP
ncbi:MAG: hypothetical protein WAV20_05380 [Blastocatellia bacterium]